MAFEDGLTLIQMDEQLFTARERIASAEKDQGAAFLCPAIRGATRKHEQELIRAGYLRQSDSAADADNWSNADHWKE